jgi:hypothetical protein
MFPPIFCLIFLLIGSNFVIFFIFSPLDGHESIKILKTIFMEFFEKIYFFFIFSVYNLFRNFLILKEIIPLRSFVSFFNPTKIPEVPGYESTTGYTIKSKLKRIVDWFENTEEEEKKASIVFRTSVLMDTIFSSRRKHDLEQFRNILQAKNSEISSEDPELAIAIENFCKILFHYDMWLCDSHKFISTIIAADLLSQLSAEKVTGVLCQKVGFIVREEANTNNPNGVVNYILRECQINREEVNVANVEQINQFFARSAAICGGASVEDAFSRKHRFSKNTWHQIIVKGR